ncbi:6-aminohexanoate hydrolase [Sphingomonas spermidinifaciens]|uniref:6-aminohexanoate hydrolase n=1 Tax=Sphingomonas spermidinifaciens TaxID=1141889 RepID=A0A2A4B2I1_9SPHN|nr:serine hydrolase [Sphingomonas spermidinifaciens]PCD02267.1 6-aminohexanoate hydrolase [Sphingomonas spermidinifaciens]
MTRRRLVMLLPLFLAAACDAEPRDRLVAVKPVAASTRGLDAAMLARTVEAAGRLPRIRSMIVLRDGQVLAEHRFNGGPPLDRPVNIKSASKPVISALVGIAIARGVLTGPDQPILPILRRDAPADPDPRLARVTIGNLLSMQAGLERTSGENYGRWVSSPDWVRFALSRPFVDEPGGRMLYSTGSTHLLSAALTRASGRSTYALAREWLGEPLGIAIPPWPRDPQGIYFGGNDMLLSPRALARFGELYRLGGRIGGRQVVPAGWIEASWTPRTTSPWSGERYGYGWFVSEMRGHPVRFAWGYGGQMLYILPDLRLTVAMTSDATAPREGGHIDALHRLVADGIVPAAERGAQTPSSP